MKKTYITFLLSIVCTSMFAQYDGPVAPNYNEIENNITLKYNYSELMNKYMAGDTEMSIEEQRHLYYGFVFQPHYNPSDTSKYNNDLSQVLNKQFLSTSDYNDVEKHAKALLTEDPFNLRALNALLLVYAQLDNSEQYKITTQKKDIVQRAISSSGDGMTKKTAFYVIKVSHEYDILGFLGFKYGGSEKIEKNCKCNSLSLATNPFDIDKVYFNIEPILDYAKRKGGGKL